MKTDYRDAKSFIGKTPVILALLGIIPFLLVVYLFVSEELNITNVVVIMSALGLFSVMAGYSLMRQSADQLVKLAIETSKIESGKQITPLATSADEELHDIATNFNMMLTRMNGISRDIKEQSVHLMIYGNDLAEAYKEVQEEGWKLRNNLGRYVGNDLVEKVVSTKDDFFIENERREVTILFADIRSFSSFSESMEAEEVVTVLNHFFSRMVEIVFRNNGILDKFIGDALMAVFGVISTDDNGALDAVKAAMEMQYAMESLMKNREKDGQVTFDIGIGINTGSAILGSVGSANRQDYTVIGNTVNMASALEAAAKGGEILVSEETYRHTKDKCPAQKECSVKLKIRQEPVNCYYVAWDHFDSS
ncbi:MAG: adenylate/guanylate cyclase domain-containing protein [Syntrophales bacterium]|nr:adenylate/guanylate cyclase domain-containing protein [Syntrophales bacterium]